MAERIPSPIPQEEDPKEAPKTPLDSYVRTHVVERNRSVEAQAEEEIKESLEKLSVREKAEKLYAKLLAYKLDKAQIGRELGETRFTDLDPENLKGLEQTDPYLIAEIKLLWADPEVRNLAEIKYGEIKKDSKSFKTSELGKEYLTLTDRIAQVEKDFEELERKLWLDEIRRPAAKEAAVSRRERLAGELISLREREERIISLNEVPSTVENTDIAAKLSYQNLMEYHRQQKEGFVWLPSRYDIHRKIVSTLQNGRWPLLIGEAGSGKSEQADAAARELTGERPTHIACSSRTNERDLIADKDIRDGVSFETYGQAMKAATGFDDSLQESPAHSHGRIVRLDESGRLGDQGYAVIKELRQKKPGDLLHGKEVLPGFSSIWTTNPVGPRYPDRRPLDPAMRREVAEIEVNYPPMSPETPEMYEFMLANLIDDRGHLPAAEIEIAPKYEPKAINRTLPNGDIIESQEVIDENSRNPEHGSLYRLSYAISEIQKAFVYGNKMPVPEDVLRFKINSDNKLEIDPNGQEQLTLSSSTITLGEVASWMEGFKSRLEKDDPAFQVKTMTEWIQFKLNTYIDQADADDKDKLRAIFNYYNLFSNPPDIDKEEPMTAKDIGYLSPRVPRPEKIRKGSPDKKTPPAPRTRKSEVFTPLETISKMLRSGEEVKVKPYEFSFRKKNKNIRITTGSSFTVGGNRFIFEGQVSDPDSPHNGKLVARSSDQRDLYDLIEQSQIEKAEGFSISIEEAKEILGEKNVIDHKDIKEVLGIEIPENEMEDIPFSAVELKRAAELGQQLIYYTDKHVAEAGIFGRNKKQAPLTLKAINDIRENKAVNNQKLFYDTDWYKNEIFYKTEAPRKGWRLTSKSFIPNSTNKNYLEQTQELVNYLRNEVFKGINPRDYLEEYKEAISEFNKALPDIQGAITSDWQKAAEVLEKLKITKLTRETPVEVFYRLLLSEKTSGVKDLPDVVTWTGRRSSYGSLVLVGNFDEEGVRVDDWLPDFTDPLLGVCFSRS